MTDAQCDADRVVEIFPRQLNDIIHQRCRHSHHHQYPETLLESACVTFEFRDQLPLYNVHSADNGKSETRSELSPWRARLREPMTGVWGRASSEVQGQSPWSAKSLLAFGHPLKAASLPYSLLRMLQTQ